MSIEVLQLQLSEIKRSTENGQFELIEMQRNQLERKEKFSLQTKSLVFMVNSTLLFEKCFNDSKVATFHNNRSFWMLCWCESLSEDSLPFQLQLHGFLFSSFLFLDLILSFQELFTDIYPHWIWTKAQLIDCQ